MTERPSQPSPRKRREPELTSSAPYRPEALAVPGPLASRLVHFDEQILDILDLPLHRLRPLPQLPVPRLQPLALALQGLALCTLPLAVPQSCGLVLVSLLLLAVPSGGGRIRVGGRARGWRRRQRRRRRGLLGGGQGRQARVPRPGLTAAIDGQQVEGVQGRGLGEVKGGEGEREGGCWCWRWRRWGGWWEQWGIEEEVFHLFQLLLEEGGHSFQVGGRWGSCGEGTRGQGGLQREKGCKVHPLGHPVREAVTCQGLSPPWKPALQGSPKDLIGAQGGRGQGEFPIVYEPAQPASWEQGPVQLQPQGRQE